jgi:hypothetical protein
MAKQPKQDAITLGTLDLLQQVADYLRRLPVVPATHSLIKKIDAHLADPNVAAEKREAKSAEFQASKRTGGRYTPVGFPVFHVVVEGDQVTFTAPKINTPPGTDKMLDELAQWRMHKLAEGITIEISSISNQTK